MGYKGAKAALGCQFMPIKPTRVGFKMWALSESETGYMANLRYQNTEKETVQHVVLQLVQPFEGRHHHLFCDKHFTSVVRHPDYNTRRGHKIRPESPLGYVFEG